MWLVVLLGRRLLLVVSWKPPLVLVFEGPPNCSWCNPVTYKADTLRDLDCSPLSLSPKYVHPSCIYCVLVRKLRRRDGGGGGGRCSHAAAVAHSRMHTIKKVNHVALRSGLDAVRLSPDSFVCPPPPPLTCAD